MMRYEIKYQISAGYLDQILTQIELCALDMYEKYPQRRVHNIYYDTDSLEAYSDNVKGLQYRQKLRLRCYGNPQSIQQYQLELKIKNNKLGTKKVFAFEQGKAFFLQCKSSNSFLHTLNPMPPFDTFLLQYNQPALYNFYDRRYFESRLRPIRITIDQRLHFQKLGVCDDVKAFPYDDVIVECKFAQADQSLAENFLHQFPFRPSRFSKYVTGMQTMAFVEQDLDQ